MKAWWARQSDFDKPWLILWLLALILLVALLPVFADWVHAAHTNERADPSAWIDPKLDDAYVYQPDPCVEALIGAMAAMQPFLPTHFKREDGLWHTTALYTDDGMNDFEAAHRLWEETKLQCMRH